MHFDLGIVDNCRKKITFALKSAIYRKLTI